MGVEREGEMLMVVDNKIIAERALRDLQTRIGGTIKGERLYPLVEYLQPYNGSPPALLSDPSWSEYVLHFEQREEQRVMMFMRRDRFPAYIPKEPSSVKKNQFERRIIMRPLLVAGYMFTSFDPADDRWKNLHSIPGVHRVLSVAGMPWPVPLAAMLRIRQRETALAIKAKKAPPMPVSIGDWVQITDGAFAGFVGRVVELLDTVARITVEVDMFGRQTPVEVSVNQVRAV